MPRLESGSKPLAPATTPTGTEPSPRLRSSAERPSDPEKAKRRARRRFWRWARRVALGTALLSSAAMITLAIYVRKVEESLPSTTELRKGYRPPQVTRILAADGSSLAELFTERRTVVKIGELPAHVKLAVLAAEDANFYEHAGLNYFGIARAAWVNLRNKKTRQGASTITQQVVKNLLLESERTYSRKIREILLARRIEQELTKDEILELYLNHIYFGSGRYGIEEAARGYFGKHAKELTVAEAALIAGLAPAPNAYNPRVDLDAAVRRRTFVLGQMREKGFVKPVDYDAAIVEPVKLAPVTEASEDIAPEVVELVRKTIKEVAGEEAARKGGFTVETTIDPKLQVAARAAVREAVAAYDKRWKLIGPFPPYPEGGRDPKTKKKLPPQEKPFEGVPKYGHGDVYVGLVTGHDDAAQTVEVQVGTVRGFVKLETKGDRYDPTGAPPSVWAPIGTRLRVSLAAPPPSAGSPAATASATAAASAQPVVHDVRVPLRLELGPESAFVAIDVRTRKVLALVGAVESTFGLDRATHAKRQPGSTFKPFVYGAALKSRKFTPASLIEATPGDFGGWNPKNSEAWTKDEPVRLRDALAASINLVAVRVAKEVGPQSVIDFARAAGITSNLAPDLAIALGSYEVAPIELANAYTTIAGGGVYEPPQIILRILGPDGRELALPARKPPTRAFNEAEAYLLTSMMTSVVEKGTASGAKVLGRPIAGKTGTSNQAKDTWFAGFTPDLVAVSWVGFDDGRPLGPNEFGGRTALPAWVSFMKVATNGKPRAEFPRPGGVVTVKIDPRTGKLPYEGQEDAIDEVFLVGTEPKDVAELPADKPKPSDLVTEDPWADAGVVPAASTSASATP
ncbi:MAG: penicillin-binding protein 1A [Polyangiales bacterium]